MRFNKRIYTATSLYLGHLEHEFGYNMVEAWFPLLILPVYKTLIITLFCYIVITILISHGSKNQCYNKERLSEEMKTLLGRM